MKLAKPIVLLGILVLVPVCASMQTRQTRQTQRQAIARWAGKYPDAKFFNQPQIKGPLRRILTKADYDSVNDYNLMVPIKRVGDYLVTYASIKYSDPLESLSLAFGLKDNAVYVVFQKGEQHRKFSTKNNEFNLPDEVLEELGLSNSTDPVAIAPGTDPTLYSDEQSCQYRLRQRVGRCQQTDLDAFEPTRYRRWY